MRKGTPLDREKFPKVYLYVEGDDSLGRGFRTLLRKWCERAHVRLRVEVVMGGSNSQTVKDWRTMRSCVKDTDRVLLLIDSEGPAPDSQSGIPDGCAAVVKSEDLSSGDVFFMVQLMEAWFLTKPEELYRIYGSGFDTGKLPEIPTHKKPPLRPGTNLEAIPKDRIERDLARATSRTRVGRYDRTKAKTRIAPRILEKLDLTQIADVSFHAKRLVERLSSICSR